MSLAAQAVTAAVALGAAVAAASLWRGAERHTGSVRHAYWLFASAVVLWGIGAVSMQALAGSASSGTFPLTLADLPGLLALPALAAGLVSLAPPRHTERHPLAPRSRGRVGLAVARLADGYVLAAAIFIIGWIVLLRPEYVHSGEDPQTFALELVHPLADLVLLAALLPVAAAAGRRGAAAFAALLAATVSDALGVGARVSSGHPGDVAQVLLLIGFCVLGWAPWDDTGRAGSQPYRPGTVSRPGAPVYRGTLPAMTALAALAAVAAAVAVIVAALAGGPDLGPVVSLAGGTAVLALTARIFVLVHRDTVRSRLWQESGQQFRELADRTSDAVLVCDYAGTVSYANRAVRAYGYTPAGLEGRMLPDLVHPEDRPAGIRAVRAAAGASARQISFACRVRAADGTWRHAETTISRYRSQSAPDRLLITARDVSDQVELRRQIAHLTYHDGLTGLPNRAYVEDRAREPLSLRHLGATDESGLAGVILVNLDGFTAVNDAIGRSGGDLVLAQVARRLRAMVPPRGTVARWGGDEFAVLIAEAPSAQEIIDLAGRIAGSITGEPFRAADRGVDVSVSVGVAFADGSPAGYVWRNADLAVSQAKESGGGRIEVFSARPHTDARRGLELAAQLSRALSEGRLDIEYQAVADLGTGGIAGAVALPRWRPEGVEVPHADFLEAAEVSGVIIELGEWLLQQSTAQAAGWHRSGWEASLWLRCSLRQVLAPRFGAEVLAALAASELPPHSLILEIAGNVLITAGDVTVRGLGELRDHGVRLAVDLSATDYGSLAQLNRVPADLIKLGPALVAGLGSGATAETLIKAMVTVGKDLGAQVMADGIDRAGQAQQLVTLGCGLGMGPFVAGPMPPTDLARLAGERAQQGSGRFPAARGLAS